MNTMNLHGLFHASINESFEQQITLSASDKEQLVAARGLIRAHIRSRIGARVRAAKIENADDISPKFITQGSWAYLTLNAPARSPQQADLDDGVYVPLSFCEDTGAPKAVSQLLIGVVEALLRDLAMTQGWVVKADNPNCTRVIIASDKHIDVPVYSIPDHEFLKIARGRFDLQKSARAFNEFVVSSDMDDSWDAMPPRVRLAHRVRGWLDSDPRPIRDWVFRQVDLKTEQLRRLMRYLKAWRDFQHWAEQDPKSLLMMAVVDQALDRKIEGRDDLALLQACSRIPTVLSGQVVIPAIPGEDLAKILDEGNLRYDLITRIQALHGTLDACVRGRHSTPEVCNKLRDQFGPRFPNRPDRIKVEAPEEVVRASAPRIIAATPVVGRREAG